MSYSTTIAHGVYEQLGDWLETSFKYAANRKPGDAGAGIAANAIQSAYNALNFTNGDGRKLSDGTLTFDSYMKKVANVVAGVTDLLDYSGASSARDEVVSWWEKTRLEAAAAYVKDIGAGAGEVLVDAAKPVLETGGKVLGAIALVLGLFIAWEVLR